MIRIMNQNTHIRKQITLILLSTLSLTCCLNSCSKEQTALHAGFSSGVYIVNEGGFLKNNGSITYYDNDSLMICENLFSRVKGRDLGDVVQSFSIAGDVGLIVVNNSQKIEVIDIETFVSLGIITGVDYPRYTLAVDDHKAYLTNGNYTGNVYIIDLNTFLITGQIPVGKGPENLVRSMEYIYVANSGGWDYDYTVSVIDPENDMVVQTIKVGDHPVDLAVDANFDVWVLCKGRIEYDADWNVVDESDSKLYKINAHKWELADSFTIGSKGDYFSPIRLAASKDGAILYFVEADGIYKIDYQAVHGPEAAWIPGRYYGMEVDPDDGTIYALKANGYDSKGKAYIYNSEGQLLDSIQTGIAPNGAAFR